VESNEEIVPIVYPRVAAKERQLPHDRISRIHGDVDEALARPHERDCGRYALVGIPEVESDTEREEDLETGAHRDVDKLAKEHKERVSCLVEYQIDVVYKVPVTGSQRRVEEVEACECGADEPSF